MHSVSPALSRLELRDPLVDPSGRSHSPATTASMRCAHLLEMAGDVDAAIAEYETAASRTTSLPENHYLTMRAARLNERRKSRGG